LYESPFDANFVIISNAQQQSVGYSDAFPANLSLAKGSFTLQLQVRVAWRPCPHGLLAGGMDAVPQLLRFGIRMFPRPTVSRVCLSPQVRHDSFSLLDGLKSLPLTLERKLASAVGSSTGWRPCAPSRLSHSVPQSAGATRHWRRRCPAVSAAAL
jgi:hypothetical protein